MAWPLLDDEMKSRLPQLYSQEDVNDPIVQVLLLGANGWIWALTEYSEVAPDGVPHLAFGWVCGDFPELGYIPMDEFDELNADCLEGFGYVWVDPDFVPRPLSQVRAEADDIRRRLRQSLDAGGHPVATVRRVG